MSNKKRMESLELSPINQENYSDLEVICKLIQEIKDKYGSEAMAFVAIDVNNEEKIGLNEFSSELQNVFDIDEDKIQVLFEMFDLDKDGLISKNDWELSFEQYPQKLAQYENSESQNSEIHVIEANKNQIPGITDTPPIRGKESKRYQTDQTPSRELVEIQTRLDSSPGLDGLMRKCNQLRVQYQTQSSVQSQFFQQSIDNSMVQRKQELALSHLWPSNFHKVQDEQVKQIFGELRTTPEKEQFQEILQNGNHENEIGKNKVNGTINITNPSYQEDNQPKIEDYRAILSQKIVSSKKQDEQNEKQKEQNHQKCKTNEDKNDMQQGQIYEKTSFQYSNPLFIQSSKMLDLPYEQRFSRILQSSSPLDHNHSSKNQNEYQIEYSNIKWEVQQQQKQYKPKKDFKNNFQSYLSLIGLGSNRNNHHGSSIPNKGNQIYYTNKQTAPTSQIQPINQSGLSNLHRTSSAERSTLISSQTFSNKIQSNNLNKSKTNKLRDGLEGIINKINVKKNNLLQNKGQIQGLTYNQQSSLSNRNQIQINQQIQQSKSKNINTLTKSSISPYSSLQSKQANTEGSLERISLISTQKNANYPKQFKENQQETRNSLKNLQQKSTQQQSILSQPLTNTFINQLRSTNQGNYNPSLTASLNFGQKGSSASTQQYNMTEKNYASQPLASSEVLGSSIKSNFIKQEGICQYKSQQDSILSQQTSLPPQELKLKTSQKKNSDLLQKSDANQQQDKPTIIVMEQNEQMFSPDDFDDYEDKSQMNSDSKNNVKLLDD